MYYTGTEQECTEYNQSVNDIKQYTAKTNNWGEVIKKDGVEVYAIKACPLVSSSLSTVDNLNGWFNEE